MGGGRLPRELSPEGQSWSARATVPQSSFPDVLLCIPTQRITPASTQLPKPSRSRHASPSLVTSGRAGAPTRGTARRWGDHVERGGRLRELVGSSWVSMWINTAQGFEFFSSVYSLVTSALQLAWPSTVFKEYIKFKNTQGSLQNKNRQQQHSTTWV